MNNTSSTELHDFLSEGGREPQSLKLLKGTAPTRDGICREAKRVIAAAIDRGMPHDPPHSGKEKIKL